MITPALRRRWTVDAVPVTDPSRQTCYFTEVAGRYYGRSATGREVAAAMIEDPSDDLVPPAGLFLVARCGDTAAGCVGLRRTGVRVAELTRMFVWPEYRRHGGGARLLAAIERSVVDLGATTVRLDTRHDLVEARNLYAKHRYIEIPAYSHGPYAEHWFEKHLA